MKMFDHHIHMTSRTTDDYRAMADAGIVAVIEPAFWVGQPRRNVGTFEDYFLSLVGWERFRARQFGIHHFCTMALNPKEANNSDVAPGVYRASADLSRSARSALMTRPQQSRNILSSRSSSP